MQQVVFRGYLMFLRLFSLTLGSTVHCIYGFFPPRDPGQNPGQKSGQRILSENSSDKLIEN